MVCVHLAGGHHDRFAWQPEGIRRLDNSGPIETKKPPTLLLEQKSTAMLVNLRPGRVVRVAMFQTILATAVLLEEQ